MQEDWNRNDLAFKNGDECILASYEHPLNKNGEHGLSLNGIILLLRFYDPTNIDRDGIGLVSVPFILFTFT